MSGKIDTPRNLKAKVSGIDPLHEVGCMLRAIIGGKLEITDGKFELYTNNEIDVKPFLEPLGFRVADCGDPQYHWSAGPKPLHPECTQGIHGNLEDKEVEGYAVYEIIDGKKKLRIMKLWYQGPWGITHE